MHVVRRGKGRRKREVERERGREGRVRGDVWLVLHAGVCVYE